MSTLSRVCVTRYIPVTSQCKHLLTQHQIFSGKLPFHEISNEYRVIFEVVNGKRPTCPSDNRSIARGLEDTIWKLVESCWAQQPMERPIAGQIVEQVQALPNEVVDRRP